MVVCKCRKSTKLYCFVHKIPVCSDCICFEEHQICVIRTYSEWVLDGDYDWPPQCSLCQQMLNDEQDTTRLGCLHILHTPCLETLLKRELPIGPADPVCPACSSVVWPPKNFKDSNTGLPLKLKEAISQIGVADIFPGINFKQSQVLPDFSSDPLISGQPHATEEITLASVSNGVESESYNGKHFNSTYSSAEIDGPRQFEDRGSSGVSLLSKKSPQPSVVHYQEPTYEDDEDANARKYHRRGPLHKQIARHLVPLWSSGLPALPISTEDRRQHSRLLKANVRKFLFLVAIMSCMATIMLLYYRLQW